MICVPCRPLGRIRKRRSVTANPIIIQMDAAKPDANTTTQLGTSSLPTRVCRIHQDPLLLWLFARLDCWY